MLTDGVLAHCCLKILLFGKFRVFAVSHRHRLLLIFSSEFPNVFPPQLIHPPEYMVLNGIAGFAYSGSFGQVSPYTQVLNSTAYFLPMNGGGFVQLSENSQWSRLLYHPQQNPFSFSPDQVDLRCVSQLNVSVANSWMGKWEGNAP